MEELFGKRKEKNKKENYRREGLELERQGKFEEAFLKYEKAAEMDDVPSMVYIARMYLSGNFRPAGLFFPGICVKKNSRIIKAGLSG